MVSRLSKQLHYLWWKRLYLPDGGGEGESERAKVAKSDRKRFTSHGLNVIWQSSILVNKWWGQGTEPQKRSKTLINYLYLHNETTLILVSRSGRKQDDLSGALDIVRISLITTGRESWFSLHRKLIVHPDHLSQPRPPFSSQGLVGKVIPSLSASLKALLRTTTCLKE